MPSRIFLSSPHMGGNEKQYVNEAFESNWIAPLGPNLEKFERSICDYTGIAHAVALSSGTGAIHLALKILGVNPGDEVLCQSFTFSATVNPVRYLDAYPVLIDSEWDTWNMDPVLLEKVLHEKQRGGKKPTAVIAVHLYGMPAKIEKIADICKKFEVPLIEDAAEALGSSVGEKMAGTFGDIGILSFNGNKIITTSGAGALISNNQEYTDKARFLATQSRDPAPYYQHSQIGYNYRLSNVLAGIGRGQMEVLPDWVEKRRKNYQAYKEVLTEGPFKELFHFPEEPPNCFSNRWLTAVLIKQQSSTYTPEYFRQKLEEDNIESRQVWKPMHLQPVFESFEAYSSGVSEDIFSRGLCLPSGSNLSSEGFERVIKQLKEAIKSN